MKWDMGWGITSLCNMKCKFCYSYSERDFNKDLTLKDWIKFVDENHEYINSINYGTGENSIIDDWFLLIKHIKENYPSITQAVTTNGYLSQKIKSNPKFEQIFKECIDEVDVSLDFATHKAHGEFRGQPQAFTWAMEMLDYLKKYNKLITIVFLGSKANSSKKNIKKIFKIGKKYDAIMRMNIYRPVSPNQEVNDKFFLSYEKLIDIVSFIGKKYKVLSLSDSLLNSIFQVNTKVYDATGKSSLRILPDGSITPSTYLISQEYKVKTIREPNVLHDISFTDTLKEVKPAKCEGCIFEENCKGGVIDRRMLVYKTLDHVDPYCPFLGKRKLPKPIKVEENIGRISVHDGYLPTLFFKN